MHLQLYFKIKWHHNLLKAKVMSAAPVSSWTFLVGSVTVTKNGQTECVLLHPPPLNLFLGILVGKLVSQYREASPRNCCVPWGLCPSQLLPPCLITTHHMFYTGCLFRWRRPHQLIIPSYQELSRLARDHEEMPEDVETRSAQLNAPDQPPSWLPGTSRGTTLMSI